MRTLGIKISIIVLKFLPVICAFVMLFHVSLLISKRLDENRVIEATEWTISLPAAPALTAIILSKQLGFCSLHRHFIIYTSIVSYCIKFQNSIGFGNFLTPMRWVMLIVGIILFTILIRHMFVRKVKLFSHGCNECNKRTAI